MTIECCYKLKKEIICKPLTSCGANDRCTHIHAHIIRVQVLLLIDICSMVYIFKCIYILYCWRDRSARALNGSVVCTAAAKDERSKLGRDGPVVSISAGLVMEGGGGRKNTLMDKMFVRKQTGPIVGNRLMGACH